jgi:hypothetical protein
MTFASGAKTMADVKSFTFHTESIEEMQMWTTALHPYSITGVNVASQQ